jgi:hypothetical protein
MHEQLLAEARKAHFAAKDVLVGLDLTGLLEQRDDILRQLNRPERLTPAEHSFEHRRCAGWTIVDPRMAGGSDRGESIIACLQLLPQCH